MSHLYPKGIPAARVTKLHTLRNSDISERYPTFPDEVATLYKKFRTKSALREVFAVKKFWDVGSGEDGINLALKKQYPNIKIKSLDKDPSVRPDITADYSCPDQYRDEDRPDVIFASMQYDLNDLLLKQAYEHAKDGIIAHVGGEYITNRPWYRRNWFEEVSLKGECRVVSDLPIHSKDRPGIKRCVWLVMFKSKASFKTYFDWPRTGLHHGMMPL